MAVAIAALAAFLIGTLTGLVIHKVKLWCGICGVTLECPTHGNGAAAGPPR